MPDQGPSPVVVHLAELVSAAMAMIDAQFADAMIGEERHGTGDIVTDLDVKIEVFLNEQLSSYQVPIYGEEFLRGQYGREHFAFVVDPLDGTNNLALGIPSYGVCITAIEMGIPVHAAISQGQTGITRMIVPKDQAIYEYPSLRRVQTQEFNLARAALWLGYGTESENGGVSAVRHFLRKTSTRILETWSPLTDLFAIMNGGVDVVIGIDCEGAELPAAWATFRALDWGIVDLESGEPLQQIHPPVSFLASREAQLQHAKWKSSQ